jgi:ribosomal protein L37AE/L43A
MASEDKEIRVYFCPKCKSTDIKYIFGWGNAFGIIPRQRCMKCGTEAAGFPILVTSPKILAKSKKAKKSGRKKR